MVWRSCTIKAFLKKRWIDISIISGLLLTCLISLLVFYLTRQNNNLIAEIYFKNEIIEKIDLNEHEQPYTFEVQGLQDKIKINVKNHSIAIIESNCPQQYCVHSGYISYSNQSIVCAYNAIYIILVGQNYQNDIEV